jgi:mannan endo-1,4-beta-mannosidase
VFFSPSSFFFSPTHTPLLIIKHPHSHPPTQNLKVAAHARQGANTLRVFFAFDFDPAGTQPYLGSFNEAALRRIDHVLVTCAAYGIRVIGVLGNYWPFVGGMQAYVDAWARSVGQGTGQPIEKFYTEPGVREAYKKSLYAIVGRRNSITGQMYKDDPTIAVWELANEPHTTDRYEANLGIRPGSILCAWVRDMARVVKGIDPHHLVASGEEGYRADKPGGSAHSWLNDGWKGSDFVCNTCETDVDVATVHVYPDSWAMPDYTVSRFFLF